MPCLLLKWHGRWFSSYIYHLKAKCKNKLFILTVWNVAADAVIILNPFTPTYPFSSIQNKDKKSLLYLLSVVILLNMLKKIVCSMIGENQNRIAVADSVIIVNILRWYWFLFVLEAFLALPINSYILHFLCNWRSEWDFLWQLSVS